MPCPERMSEHDGGQVTYYSRYAKASLFNQNYTQIRERCLANKELFLDPEFQAHDDSLYYKNPPTEDVHWRRPHEIHRRPQWMTGDFSRFDVVQGELGDCWLLAAIGSLTGNQRLIAQVVPPQQSFQHGYCGIFRFRLWYQGQWVEVVVDDRLPTYNEEYPQLMYMHSASKCEFWSALLEKAYAKLHGCYECLQGGSAIESLEDLTGGLGETIQFAIAQGEINPSLEKRPQYLLQVMLKTLERGGLLTCSMNPQEAVIDVRRSHEGLMYNHTYSITAIRQITSTRGSRVWLLRVRNPWGDAQEWRGAWSDGSPEWQQVPLQLQRQMSLTFEQDGEFWMSFKDFTFMFTKMDLCNLDPLYLPDPGVDTLTWDVVSYHKAWIKYVNAGGCLNYIDSMWKNPQFRVTLLEADDPNKDKSTCTLIVALLQKDRRRLLMEGQEFLNIGYVIYELLPGHERTLDRKYFGRIRPVGKSGSFTNTREVTARHQLPPGNYVIIPSTFQPDQDAHFLLRIFTEKHKTSREIDDLTSYSVTARDVVDGEVEGLDALTSAIATLEKIDAVKLADVLKSFFVTEFPFSGFSQDLCRSMVMMLTIDGTDCLNVDQYSELCQHLIQWKTAFENEDTEKTGQISSYILRPILANLGFRVSNDTLKNIILRYVNSDGNIEFVDFIQCTVLLKTMMASFEKSNCENIDKFIQDNMYT